MFATKSNIVMFVIMFSLLKSELFCFKVRKTNIKIVQLLYNVHMFMYQTLFNTDTFTNYQCVVCFETRYILFYILVTFAKLNVIKYFVISYV